MTGTQTLFARGALGAIGAVVSVLLARYGRLQALPSRTFDRGVFAAMAVSRLGLFVLIFLVLHVAPRGDIQAYYLPQAIDVLHHLIPYRDFLSSYAPLHPYLDAVFVRLWPTSLSIMLSSVLAELLILPLWLRTGRAFLPEPQLRIASLLYLASPISLQFVVVDGQDNVLIAVLIALSLLLLLRQRSLLSGAVLGLAVAAIKFLPILYIPAYLLAMSRRWRWVAGAAIVLAAVYGGFLLLHAPILQPLAAEGALRGAGNLPYLLESLFGITIPGGVSNLVLLLVLAAIFALIARAALRASADAPASPEARMRIIAFGTCALTLALLLFAKKSWPPYLMLTLFPLCLLPPSGGGGSSRPRLSLYAIFSLVAVTEHSVWASLLGECSSADLHQAILAHTQAALFLPLELLLLAGYGWLLYESLRQVAFALPTVADAKS